MKLFKTLILFLITVSFAQAQTVIKGIVTDEGTGEALIGASVIIENTTIGSVTEYDGTFEIKTDEKPPFNIIISYTGFSQVVLPYSGKDLKVKLSESAVAIDVVEVKGQRISEKQKAAPLTIESLDLLAIKETPSDNFYDGLGSLKGVDLTAASLGFKVINMRGFNSTSPVRSLQIIDGVDNQAPGLNFSLGNFLGSPELDVLKVDLIQGASSAYYGPNAFNGVIAMETKNPFILKGLSGSLKAGERNLYEGAFRYADALKNKEGLDWFAYKINFSFFDADDWVADNDLPVDGTTTPFGNPGRWDQVNVYGDEYQALYDFSDTSNITGSFAGLGTFHRRGFRELDLVDYSTQNIKANTALHFRLKPEETYESPELILAGNFGNGTTVYQGDNRFSLRDILFYQARIEIRKKDKYFLRAYTTVEDAGNSFDPYFTALKMQELAKPNELWQQDYVRFWTGQISPKFRELGYPQPIVFQPFDTVAAYNWFEQYADSLQIWHQQAADFADRPNILNPNTRNALVPGTPEFQMAFDSITSLKNTEGGTRFFDQSALYHVHGEYIITPEWLDRWTVGGNVRLYRPFSEGTVFQDTNGVRITNSEFGFYSGIEKKYGREWTLGLTARVDKNRNFNYIFTPAASVVYSPDINNYLRASFSQGVRNPTLNDQYLNLNVGRATLLGNLNGFDGLYTLESYNNYLNSSLNLDTLRQFSVPGVKPERVRTFEVGYRTTLFEKLYIDAGYFYSIYRDFIGFNIGLDATFDTLSGFPLNVDAYRISANSTNQVTTQGVSIGANYYFSRYYGVNGNYSWNRLNKSFPDDPIIPAFNTPEHKFNVGFNGRNMPVNLGFARLKSFGFNINYKWIQGFTFEGSPQFTGNIPSYALLDGQINAYFSKIHTTFKIGASNILNNLVFQTYGGPRIGRLAYASITYNWEKK